MLRSFQSGQMTDFSCTPTGDTSCNLWVDPVDVGPDAGKQFMKIKAPRNNGIGDVGIGREFRARPNQNYTATATVSMINVTESGNEDQLYARLTIIPILSTGGQITECNSPLKISKDTADHQVRFW